MLNNGIARQNQVRLTAARREIHVLWVLLWSSCFLRMISCFGFLSF